MTIEIIPEHLRHLPRDPKGRAPIVPWFVVWLDAAGKAVRPRTPGAVPDFRVVKPDAVVESYRNNTCWLCGKRLGRFKAFVVGPMCCINRTTAETPSHFVCAEYAVKTCPFLSNPAMRRSPRALPDGSQEPAGDMITRNPGVTAIWVCKDYKPFRAPNGILFHMGEPERLPVFYAQGRLALPWEIAHSVRTGLPLLYEVAKLGGPRELAELERCIDQFLDLVREISREDIRPTEALETTGDNDASRAD